MQRKSRVYKRVDMPRRCYYVNKKRRAIERDALGVLQRTRENIDPGLLEKAREAIACAIENDRTGREERYQNAVGSDMVFVDRRKVVSLVARYLEMNPDNGAIFKELQSFIKGH